MEQAKRRNSECDEQRAKKFTRSYDWKEAQRWGPTSIKFPVCMDEQVNTHNTVIWCSVLHLLCLWAGYWIWRACNVTPTHTLPSRPLPGQQSRVWRGPSRRGPSTTSRTSTVNTRCVYPFSRRWRHIYTTPVPLKNDHTRSLTELVFIFLLIFISGNISNMKNIPIFSNESNLKFYSIQLLVHWLLVVEKYLYTCIFRKKTFSFLHVHFIYHSQLYVCKMSNKTGMLPQMEFFNVVIYTMSRYFHHNLMDAT